MVINRFSPDRFSKLIKKDIVKENGMEGIFKAVKELDKLKRQAMALGLFVDDRDLLECSSCGLQEDITFEGTLMVYQKDDQSFEDCGLRFREVDEGHFECPKCKAIIKVVAQDDSENKMIPADAGDTQRCSHE
jgi:hypothetical protein